MNKAKYLTNLPPIVVARNSSIALSVVMILFALSAIIGWQFHIPSLILYDDSTIAIPFNTALCFMLIGIGILFWNENHSKLALLLNILTISFCNLSLTQNLFGLDLKIDNMFFTVYEYQFNSAPGRIATIAALFMIISGITLILLQNCKNITLVRMAGSLGCILLTLNFWYIGESVFNSTHILVLPGSTPMAVTTSVGFVFLSANIIAIFIQKSFELKLDFPTSLNNIIICLILTIISLIVARITTHQTSNIIWFMSVAVFLIGFMTISYLLIILSKYIYRLKQSFKMLDTSTEASVLVDLNGTVLNYNKMFVQMLNYEHAGNHYATYYKNDLVKLENACNFVHSKVFINGKFPEPVSYQGNVEELSLKSGPIYQKITNNYLIEGKLVGYTHTYRNITDQKRLEATLIRTREYDPATNLPNKYSAIKILDEILIKIKKKSGHIAVYSIEINNFSTFAYMFDHIKSDLKLAKISKDINNLFATELCMFARLDGFVFLGAKPFSKGMEETDLVINSLIQLFEKSFNAYGKNFTLNVSIGVALNDGIKQDATGLIANADLARSSIRTKESNAHEYYNDKMQSIYIDNANFTNEIINAIDNNEFIVYYQPVINLKQKLPVGLEALARWKTSDGQIISPADFIPYAERFGLISRISEIILYSACKQLNEWHKNGMDDLTMAINISPLQFKDRDFVNIIQKAIVNCNIDAKYLILEITEGAFIDNHKNVEKTLSQLVALGVTISIDDFGTKFSSFEYIKKFPVKTVKIDQSFVRNLEDREIDQVIVTSMIKMCKALNLTIVAEGVETEGQLDFLETVDCEQVQGYYFSRPLSEIDCTTFLSSFYNIKSSLKNIILSDMALNDFKNIYPIFDLISNGIAITDVNSKIIYVNPFYSQVTGYSRQEAIGQNPGLLRSGYHDTEFYKGMWDSINANGYWEGEVWNRNKSGKVYPTLLTITRIVNTNKQAVNYIAVFSDISFMKQEDKTKINLAFYDFLTKLPNRLSLEDYFRRITSKYNRSLEEDPELKLEHGKIAIIFLDLNKFKQVNDKFGHVVGDVLLKEIAVRLQSITRASDMISRYGGDEFVAIMNDIKSNDDVKTYCDRIDGVFIDPYIIYGNSIKSSCCIGVSILPDDGESFEELIRKADRAMYEVKMSLPDNLKR